MNQERIGKFIYQLRKEKNMTQQELADKLNVTDRAVSHWENEHLMPYINKLGNTEVVLLPGDHYIFEQKPEELSKIINEFINTIK